MSTEAPRGSSTPDCAGDCAIAEAVTRRAFMERVALAALGTALAACGDGQFGPTAVAAGVIPDGASATFLLSDLTALATVGGVATASVAGVPIAIGRTGAASFVAWSLVCPHQSQAVTVVAGGFRCAGHGATWNASGAWTGGQATSNLADIPVTYDAAAGTLTLNGAPTVEQDFTVDLAAPANAALATVGGWVSVTRPIPKSTRTTRILIARTGASEYLAYGAACGHQGKYVEYNATLRHWRCPEHDAEFALDGAKIRDATENTRIPTANLVRLQVTQTANTLRIVGNAPPQGNP
jgi:Rieske Fe-S protein